MQLNHIKGEAVLAEFIGTFGLTFALLVALSSTALGLEAGLVAAITLGLFVLIIGPISGCHINPAITAAVLSIGKIKPVTAAAYFIAQFSGALLALTVYGVFNNNELFELGGTTEWSVFWAEVLGAAMFGFAVASAIYNDAKSVAASLTVGGGLLIGIVFASVASNGILNPAVAIGVGSYTWPYLAGPVVGSIIGMQIYKILLTPKTPIKASKAKAKK